MAEDNPAAQGQPGRSIWTALLGVLLLGLGPLWLAVLAVELPEAAKLQAQGKALVNGAPVSASPENTQKTEQALLMVMIAAAGLGAYIHSATSFATFVGNAKFDASWTWWYLLRTPIGIGLAMLVYLASRAGVLLLGAQNDGISAYGVAFLGGTAAMFSKQASDKLREVFDTAFRTAPGKGDAERSGKLDEAAPKIATIFPPALTVGQAAPLKVTGINFDSASQATVNGAVRALQAVSATNAIITLTADDVAKPGTLRVVIKAPPPSDLRSAEFSIEVKAAMPAGQGT